MRIAKITRKAEKRVMEEASGLWKDLKESGVEYERKIRKGWERRIARETR